MAYCNSRRLVVCAWTGLSIGLLCVYIHLVNAQNRAMLRADNEWRIVAGWVESPLVPWHARPHCESGLPGCSNPCLPVVSPQRVSPLDETIGFYLGIGARPSLGYTLDPTYPDVMVLTTERCTNASSSEVLSEHMSEREAKVLNRLAQWKFRASLSFNGLPVYDASSRTLGLAIGHCTVQGCYLYTQYDVVVVKSRTGQVIRVSATPAGIKSGNVDSTLIRIGSPMPSWSMHVAITIDEWTGTDEWWQYYASLHWRNDNTFVIIEVVCSVVALVAVVLLGVISYHHVHGSAACYKILVQTREKHNASVKPSAHRSDEIDVEFLGRDELDHVDNIAHRFKVHLASTRVQPAYAHVLARIVAVGTWYLASIFCMFGVYMILAPGWAGDISVLLLLILLLMQPLAQIGLVQVKAACQIPASELNTSLTDCCALLCAWLAGWVMASRQLSLLSGQSLAFVLLNAFFVAGVMAWISFFLAQVAAKSDAAWQPRGGGYFPADGINGSTGLDAILLLGNPQIRSRRLCTRAALISFCLDGLLTGIQAGYVGWQLGSMQWHMLDRSAVFALAWLVLITCVSVGTGAALAIYVRVVVDETAEWWWHVVNMNMAPFAVLYILACIHRFVVWPEELYSPGTRVFELAVLAIQGILFALVIAAVSVWCGKAYIGLVLYPSYVEVKNL